MIFGLLAKMRDIQTNKEEEEYWLLLSRLIAVNVSDKDSTVSSNYCNKGRPEIKESPVVVGGVIAIKTDLNDGSKPKQEQLYLTQKYPPWFPIFVGLLAKPQ